MAAGEAFPGETLTLDSGPARLVVATQGGGILRFDTVGPDRQAVPVFVPAEGPLKGGCQLLVPWSNRISGGGFGYESRFHPVEANLEGERCPLHGDGFQRRWTVARHERGVIELELQAGAIGPYRYMARASYRLNGTTLLADLTVRNQADIALPYGLGFHPWFPRTATTTIKAFATEVQLQDEQYLPTKLVAIGKRRDLDFAKANTLPPGWVNNAFLGWDSRAELRISADGAHVSIMASPELDTYIVYSPSAEADFFCFEPVSHAVDAHHGVGLTRLEPGEQMTAALVVQVQF